MPPVQPSGTVRSATVVERLRWAGNAGRVILVSTRLLILIRRALSVPSAIYMPGKTVQGGPDLIVGADT
jgi:hypothetical protein